jgi:hypothetical protein
MAWTIASTRSSPMPAASPRSSFAQELLDPVGFADEEDAPPPPFAPAGFTSSNEQDGLSFAQGSSIPRTFTVFGSVAADELAGRARLPRLLRGQPARRQCRHDDVRPAGQRWDRRRELRRYVVPESAFPPRAAAKRTSDGTPVSAPMSLLLYAIGSASLQPVRSDAGPPCREPLDEELLWDDSFLHRVTRMPSRRRRR